MVQCIMGNNVSDLVIIDFIIQVINYDDVVVVIIESKVKMSMFFNNVFLQCVNVGCIDLVIDI